MCLVLRELQVGVEISLLPTSLALGGESHPTTTSPQGGPAAGGTLQPEARPLVCPRMGISPGERRSQLGGKSLTRSQRPRAGESNPKQPPTAGATVEGAITPGTGENLRRTRRVPPTQAGRETQEAGRKNHEAGECLPQDLGCLEVEEIADGESQCASVPVALPKTGGPSLRMGPAVVVVVIVVVAVVVEEEEEELVVKEEEEIWAPGAAQAQ